MNKVVIVGGVAAGATAAARVRRLSSEAQITILESGPDISFANCGLPYHISGDIERRSKLILQSPESFREQYDVQVEIETEAIAIDRERKLVRARRASGGEIREFPYDRLILAQGGTPLLPRLPGVEKEHVFALWTLRDMDAINAWMDQHHPASAVVVGGGFIGLEMVEALRARGLEIELVERLPHVMPNLAPEIAGYLTEEMQAHGVRVHTGASVASISEGHVQLGDGRKIAADMVLMSVGVKPTLELAESAGLDLGSAGGLVVNDHLQTSDPHIYAAGDMVEIRHGVSGREVRIPLAGPANRQGRIAAGNALGDLIPGIPRKAYAGAYGTSIVKVFEAAAGSTGLNPAQAEEAGFEVETAVIHKDHHTSYYPGARLVTVMLVYERSSGRLLGGQVAGHRGADKRLDVLATAIASGMTISQLSELDFGYAPPFGSANDPLNMAAFVAENRVSGYSPSITAVELDALFAGPDRPALVLDLRDPFAFDRGHIEGATNTALSRLEDAVAGISSTDSVLLLSADGKTGHQALRRLRLAGYERVWNLSGGYVSLERHARAVGFANIDVPIHEPEHRESADRDAGKAEPPEATEAASAPTEELGDKDPLVVDVRTPEEYEQGAYPGAVNIPLDELDERIDALGSKEREITVYCASGARSAYAKRMLERAGFDRIENGGGLIDMMSERV